MRKILVVDDQPDIRRMMRYALVPEFAVQEAASGAEALASILAEAPDAVLLDIMMPGELDGLELCARIKADPSLARIHVVLMTAMAQVADQERGLALGADAYFSKPFSPAALTRHLQAALGMGAQPGAPA